MAISDAHTLHQCKSEGKIHPTHLLIAVLDSVSLFKYFTVIYFEK
jgi:hypothetical protein